MGKIGELLFNMDRVSVLQVGNSGDGWRIWLYNKVNELNATELYI